MSETTEATRCSARVYDQLSRRFGGCSRKAKVERDSKPFCGQHDPEAQKAKSAARMEKWDRERAVYAGDRKLTDARLAAADLIERGDVTKAEFAAAQDAIKQARAALEALRA